MDAEKIKDIILNLDSQNNVEFIILFGSVAEGRATPLSDIDIAIGYRGNDQERFRFRLRVSGELPNNVDVHIFQDLPLTVKRGVLGGKLLFYRNYELVVEESMKVIREYNTFEKYYQECLNELREEVYA